MPLERVDGGVVLDLGCGARKRDGALGIDLKLSSAADLLFDLDARHWPLRDACAGSVVCSHIIEHVASVPAFLDEIHRVSVKGARVRIVTPHFSCWRSYADPTHVRHLSLFSMDHFTDPDSALRLTRGRFRLHSAELRFDRGLKNLLPRWIARRFPRVYERHLAFVLPARTLVFELEPI